MEPLSTRALSPSSGHFVIHTHIYIYINIYIDFVNVGVGRCGCGYDSGAANEIFINQIEFSQTIIDARRFVQIGRRLESHCKNNTYHICWPV